MTRPWYYDMVEKSAAAYNLDPKVVEAIIMQESNGRTAAYRYEPVFYDHYIKNNPQFNTMDQRRSSSSYGLCQVMYTTAVQYGFDKEPEFLFIPWINIEYGCRVLSDLVVWAKGDVWKAVQAYNGGKGNWDSPMAQHYMKSVFDWFRKISLREGEFA